MRTTIRGMKKISVKILMNSTNRPKPREKSYKTNSSSIEFYTDGILYIIPNMEIYKKHLIKKGYEADNNMYIPPTATMW